MKTSKLKFLLLISGLFLINPLFANGNEGIQFMPEETKFQQLLDKAKQENKLIFIDAYTTWCGPCKWLAKNVFTDAEVGAFFNENFINAKFDMEKGEGIELAKKYEVRAYPTLLFINGDGEMIHRICGAGPKESFLEESKLALNTEENLSAYLSKYESGNRDLKFLNDLLLKTAKACMSMDEVAKEYWNLQERSEWASEENWPVFQSYVNDFESDQFQYLLNNMDAFKTNEDRASKVEDFAGRIMYYAMARSIYKNDMELLADYRNKIKEIDLESARLALVKAALLEYERAKNWTNYAQEAVNYIEEFGFDDPGMVNSLAWKVYQNVEDQEIIKKAAGWMNELLKNESNKKYAYIDTYAALLLKAGDLEEGRKVAFEAIEIAKTTGDDYSGTEELLQKYKE